MASHRCKQDTLALLPTENSATNLMNRALFISLFEFQPLASATISCSDIRRTQCPQSKRWFTVEQDWSSGRAEMLDSDITFFPDWISGVAQTVVSEKVLGDLLANQMTGFRPHRLHSLKVTPQLKLHPEPWPTYYLLEITGKINYDRHYYDENEGGTCSGCQKLTAKPGGKYMWGGDDSRKVPEEESWSGDDLMRSYNIKTGYLYLSRRLVDLGLEKEWSCFGAGSFDGQWILPLKKDTWFEDYERFFDEQIVPEYQKLPQTESLRNRRPEGSL